MEAPNEEKKFNPCDKLVDLSKDMWRNPIKGMAIAVLIDIFYLYSWCNHINSIAICCYVLLGYITYNIFREKMNVKP
jgi:hypothetical protein